MINIRWSHQVSIPKDQVLKCSYGSDHKGGPVLLPGFAITWQQNQVTRQVHLPGLTHMALKFRGWFGSNAAETHAKFLSNLENSRLPFPAFKTLQYGILCNIETAFRAFNTLYWWDNIFVLRRPPGSLHHKDIRNHSPKYLAELRGPQGRVCHNQQTPMASLRASGYRNYFTDHVR